MFVNYKSSIKSFFISFIVLFACLTFVKDAQSGEVPDPPMDAFKVAVEPGCTFLDLSGFLGIEDQIQTCVKDEEVTAGTDIWYLIQIKNPDSTLVRNDVVVFDEFPDGFQFLGVSGTQFDISNPQNDQPITCSTGTFFRAT